MIVLSRLSMFLIIPHKNSRTRLCYYIVMSQKIIYYTYILKCGDGSYYTGKTTDLEKRIQQHNGLIAGGAKYTRARRPVKMIYVESFQTHAEACLREAEIKTLTHEEKERLCLTTQVYNEV